MKHQSNWIAKLNLWIFERERERERDILDKMWKKNKGKKKWVNKMSQAETSCETPNRLISQAKFVKIKQVCVCVREREREREREKKDISE